MPYGLPYWPGSSSVRFNVPNAELGLPANYWTGGAATTTPSTPTVPATSPMPLTKPVSYAAPQKQTIQDNVSAVPDIKALAEMINGIQQAAQQKANYGRIPGGQALEEQSSRNIGSYLGGQVPDDARYRLAMEAAQRGVATGSPYGANANAGYLRALGLTSLDLMNKGQEQLTAAVGRNPAAPLFDPSSLLITPYQREQLRLAEEKARLEQEQLRLEAERVAILQSQAATNQLSQLTGTPRVGYGNSRPRNSYGSGWSPGQMLVPPGYYMPGSQSYDSGQTATAGWVPTYSPSTVSNTDRANVFTQSDYDQLVEDLSGGAF